MGGHNGRVGDSLAQPPTLLKQHLVATDTQGHFAQPRGTTDALTTLNTTPTDHVNRQCCWGNRGYFFCANQAKLVGVFAIFVFFWGIFVLAQ